MCGGGDSARVCWPAGPTRWTGPSRRWRPCWTAGPHSQSLRRCWSAREWSPDWRPASATRTIIYCSVLLLFCTALDRAGCCHPADPPHRPRRRAGGECGRRGGGAPRYSAVGGPRSPAGPAGPGGRGGAAQVEPGDTVQQGAV